MKRTLIERIPIALPEHILKFTEGARIYDSSCSPEARVYLIDKDGGYYLKAAAAGTLKREAEMTAYFHSKGLSPEVIDYRTYNGGDLFLTAAAKGEDCTHSLYLENPERLCDTIAQNLRKLHELCYTGCPVTDRMAEYAATVENNYRTGNYDSSHFPDSFGYRSADEAIATFREGKDSLKNDVLLHGDYCLPNIMLDGWRFSAFIDVGNGGVGDRHVDLFWGAWTLGFNLHTDKYRDRFLDAYGRDKVDGDLLRVIAAAEVFG